MSKAITFFRNRQQGTGQTYELEIQDSARAYQIYIYARKPLDEALVRTRQLRGGSAKDEVDKIMQALQRGEGGVIASTYEQNSQRSLWIIPVVSGGKAAFGSFGLLRPGHPSLHLEPLNEKSLYFPPGSHALIPIDKEAEEYLRGFQEYIGYLPPDLESLVLHAIRDPSLDTRMGRLEATVFEGRGKPAAAQSRRSGVAQPWFKKLLKPVPVWPAAAAVLGLMLAVNSILLYLHLNPSDDSAEATGESTEPGQEKNKLGPGIRDILRIQTATPEQKVFEVIEAVHQRNKEKGGSDPVFKTLSEGHFAKVRESADLPNVLVPSDDGKLLVVGFMKLEALRLDSTAESKLFGAANNPTTVSGFYTDQKLNPNGSSRDMLAALVCKVHTSPEVPKPNPAGAFRFSDQSCDKIPIEKAASGLDELLKFVQKTS